MRVYKVQTTTRRLKIPDDWGRPDGRALSCLAIWSTSRIEGGGDHTTMLRRRDVGAAPADTLSRIWPTSSLTVPRPSLSSAPSSAPLLPFLTSGPDLGAWLDCWVSVEFFYDPIPRKGSTRRFKIAFSSLKNLNIACSFDCIEFACADDFSIILI